MDSAELSLFSVYRQITLNSIFPRNSVFLIEFLFLSIAIVVQFLEENFINFSQWIFWLENQQWEISDVGPFVRPIHMSLVPCET
jgi:hypothetical protein